MMLRRAFFSGGDPLVFFHGAGNNQFGELGLAGTLSAYTTAAGPGDFQPQEFVLPVASPWNQAANWRQISMYFRHQAVIRTDGTLWMSGSNQFGQLGRGNVTDGRTLVQVGSATNWLQSGTGIEFSTALNADGDIWTCGRNDIAAQLNDGTTGADRTTLYNTALTAAPFRPSAGIRFRDMWVGWRWVMGLDHAGDLWTWGNNGSRQLGRGSPENGGQNFTADRYCLKVDPAGPWQKAAAGAYGAAGIHADGQVWMWGLFSQGQRGPGVASQAPAVVVCNNVSQRWVDVNCGEYSTFFIRLDGTMWAAGQNTSGELGIGTTVDTSTLTQVIGTSGPTTVTQWREVSCGLNHTLAVAIDGTLWGWGSNTNRKLGAAALAAAQYSLPQRISALTGWRQVQAGELSSLVQKLA